MKQSEDTSNVEQSVDRVDAGVVLVRPAGLNSVGDHIDHFMLSMVHKYWYMIHVKGSWLN